MPSESSLQPMIAAWLYSFRNLSAAALLLALCAAVGLKLLGRLAHEPEDPAERLLCAVGLGVYPVALLLLVIGAAGGYHKDVFILLAVLLALLTHAQLIRIPVLIRDAYTLRQEWGKPILLACWTLAGLFMISQALYLPVEYDDLAYQLRLPELFLQKGGIYLPPDNLHIAFIQMFQMLYIPLLAFGCPSAPALLNAAFALLLGLAAHAFCRNILNCRNPCLCAVSLWTVPLFVLIPASARIDVSLAFYLFLAHYMVMAAVRHSETDGKLVLAAIFLSLALSVKLLALPYAVGLLPVVALAAGAQKGVRVRTIIRLTGICALLAVPWFLKNWILLGSPLFNLMSSAKADSWLAPCYAGHSLPADVPFDVARWVGSKCHMADLLARPEILTVEGDQKHYHLQAFLLLLPFIFWRAKDKKVVLLGIPCIAYFAFCLWSLPVVNLRYYLPLFAPLACGAAFGLEDFLTRSLPDPPAPGRKPQDLGITLLGLLGLGYAAYFIFCPWELPKGYPRYTLLLLTLPIIGAAVGLHRFLKNAQPERRVQICLALCLIGALIPSGGAMFDWARGTDVLHCSLGLRTQSACRKQKNLFVFGSTNYLTISEKMHQLLPADSMTLMLFEARAYGFKVPVLEDMRGVSWPLLAQLPDPAACLRSASITHIMVNSALFNWWQRQGFVQQTPNFSADRLSAFLKTRATSLFCAGGMTLYRLDGPGPREPKTALGSAPGDARCTLDLELPETTGQPPR